jgi:hypothetical protein
MVNSADHAQTAQMYRADLGLYWVESVAASWIWVNVTIVNHNTTFYFHKLHNNIDDMRESIQNTVETVICDFPRDLQKKVTYDRESLNTVS